MTFLLSLMDLNAALRTAVAWARSEHGESARVTGIVFLLLALVFGFLSWYFDIESTIIFTRSLSTSILATLSLSVLVYAQLILLLIAAAPTLIRMSFSPLANRGFQLAAILVFMVGLLDARTDWPRTRAFFDSLWFLFEPMGIAARPAWFISRLVWLFFATDGFEICFVVTLVCAVILIRNSVAKKAAVAT